MFGLLNTSDNHLYPSRCYQPGSASLITSLQKQPLLVVLRPDDEVFYPSYHAGATAPGFPLSWAKLLDDLNNTGVRHLELAWRPDSAWVNSIKILKSHWPDFLLGATSICCADAVRDAVQAGLTYATSPFLDGSLQKLAYQLGLLLVPGVLSPTEIHQAIQLGCNLVKLFPASIVGPHYWRYLRAPLKPFPAVIAAGGLKVSDLDNWLNTGHNAVALGQSLLIDGVIDPSLYRWISQHT